MYGDPTYKRESETLNAGETQRWRWTETFCARDEVRYRGAFKRSLQNDKKKSRYLVNKSYACHIDGSKRLLLITSYHGQGF